MRMTGDDATKWRVAALALLLALQRVPAGRAGAAPAVAPAVSRAESPAESPATWPPANRALLHSARAWEAHDRNDLAQAALRKLVESRPDLPQVLLELGELDLRSGDFADAHVVLELLERRFPQSATLSSFTLEYRIGAREHVQFAAVSQLIALKRFAEARLALDRLFPDGAPKDALGIEYFELTARIPGGWQPAYQGLSRLVQLHPDDPRYQLALVRHMLAEPPYRVAALNLLLPLVDSDEVRAGEVDALMATALRELGAARAPEELVRAYLKRHPSDAGMLELREQLELAREERLLSSAQHWGEVLADLQSRLGRQLAASPASAAGAQAERWLTRSRTAFRARQMRRAAAELRAALGFGHKRFEDEIAVAQELEAQGLTDEAGELLGAAATLAPESAWLLESWARWLIGHGRAGEALALLQDRPPGGRFTPAIRNELLAEGFAQRANDELAAGALDAAVHDLESAIALRPRDAWLRYRLAMSYSARNEFERGRAVMSDGARLAAGDRDMRYAQGLYLASLGDYAGALEALDHIDAAHRGADIDALRDRVRVTLACDTALALVRAGNLAGARAALTAVEALAVGDLSRAAQLAYAWIQIGSAEHGLGLVRPYVSGAGAAQPSVLLTWAQVLNSAEDSVRLGEALDRLRALPVLDTATRAEVVRLQRALDLRVVRGLLHEGRYAEAARRLDALLLADPTDRALRSARAELYLTMGQPRQARDLYARLVAERPDDIESQLNYVRALTESGNLKLARAVLHAIADKVPADPAEMRINLARRQLALGEAGAALASLQAALALPLPRADVLMLAARAEILLRNLTAAREYFARAELAGDGDEARAAVHELEALEARLQPRVTAGALVRHQPGDAGMSQLDIVTLPSAWVVPLNYDERLTARADAVTLDAGHAADSRTTLLGTLQAAAPGQVPRYSNGRESGVSVGAGYANTTLAADVGTSPLGFERSNIVGGVTWTPTWNSANFNVGVARRPVTNSELSYAGLRDPITGTKWGGVVQTGPFAGIALYREGYSLSGSLQVSELTGTHVEDNTFASAHLAADWKVLRGADLSATAGVTLDYWNYQHNLSNYTFGSGGYYSPQSYVSMGLPLEVNGVWRGWSYRTRVALSYSVSNEDQSPFYPDDAALQSAAAHTLLPPGYSSPNFASSHDNALGYSAYVAAEKRVIYGLVIGAMLSIDRTNYYHPTTAEFYIRHGWSGPARVIVPVQPIRPYNP
jgi:Tfp pilus assembly protein PilF